MNRIVYIPTDGLQTPSLRLTTTKYSL